MSRQDKVNDYKKKWWLRFDTDYKGKLLAYYSKTHDIYFTNQSRQRRQMKLATPQFYDTSLIHILYQTCIRLNQIHKTEFRIIPRVPFRHKTVCGLFVYENLQIVSRSYARLSHFDANVESARYGRWLKGQGL